MAPATMMRLGGSYQLIIAPTDKDGDGIAETGGYSTSYSGTVAHAAGNFAVVTLPPPQASGSP